MPKKKSDVETTKSEIEIGALFCTYGKLCESGNIGEKSTWNEGNRY